MSSPGGSASLDEAVGQVLTAIVREDNGAPSQVAFVVDRSFVDPFGRALEVALAATRAKAPTGSYALVSCGQDDGIWSARIEVPLTPDLYPVLRAAARVRWTSNGTAIPAAWNGLSKATELSWLPGSSRPHVVVLTDDRPDVHVIGAPPVAAVADVDVRARVTSWAQKWHADLHVVRVSPEPPPGPRSEGDDRLGTDISTITGLFRKQHHVRARGVADLTGAIQEALSRASDGDGSSDFVIVDDQGDGVDGAGGALSRAAPAFHAFCSAPNHRLALVRWGNGMRPTTMSDFTTDAVKITRLGSKTPRSGRPTVRDALLDALEHVRHLSWAPKGRKGILVFSGPYLHAGRASLDSILDWTTADDVDVTIVGP